MTVVVVGGGILGCAIAAACARRSLRVLLCERGRLAGGASDLPLALLPAAVDASSYLALHHFTGGAFLLDRSPPDEWPARRLDVRAAAAAFAAEARSHRAEIRTGCDVKALVLRRDAIAGVLTDEGVVEASAVVLAAGLRSSELCATAGVLLPCGRDEGAIVVAEAPAGVGEAPLVEGDAWAAIDRAGRLVASEPDALPGLELAGVGERRLVELEIRDGASPELSGLVVARPAGRWGIAEAPSIAEEIAERISHG